jgi:hypothetical protein
VFPLEEKPIAALLGIRRFDTNASGEGLLAQLSEQAALLELLSAYSPLDDLPTDERRMARHELSVQ